MDGRAERQTDIKKRVVSVLNFVIAPKKKPIVLYQLSSLHFIKSSVQFMYR